MVDDVLRRAKDGVTASSGSTPAPPCRGVPDARDGPDVQLWPHVHGTDAMYLALLRRGSDTSASIMQSR